MSKIHNIFALDKKTRDLKHIGDVSHGNGCGCVCAACNEDLCAKTHAIEVKPYFSHQPGSKCSVGGLGFGGGKESIFHYALKEAIFRLQRIPLGNSLCGKTIALLGYASLVEEHHLVFSNPEIERKLLKEKSRLQPDVKGVLHNQKLAIEVTYTHATDDVKKSELQALGYDVIEVILDRHNLPDIAELVEARYDKKWEVIFDLCKPSIAMEWPQRWLELANIIKVKEQSELGLIECNTHCESLKENNQQLREENSNYSRTEDKVAYYKELARITVVQAESKIEQAELSALHSQEKVREGKIVAEKNLRYAEELIRKECGHSFKFEVYYKDKQQEYDDWVECQELYGE